MAVKVRIPTALRKFSNGASEVEIQAASISEAVSQLEVACPGIGERLLDESGQIRRFINLYVNGEDVRFASGIETTLKTGDEVSIVPAMAGG